jgi:hypothetical protein
VKTDKKPRGIRHKIREDKKRRNRIGAAVLIGVIFFSILLINSILNQPSKSQPVSSNSQPKAAIVDQLSLTFPNQTFIQAATAILEQAGYSVDYYPSENVTVDFFRNLATHDYGIVILRVHSTATGLQGTEYNQIPVVLFTSEIYTQNSYAWEQLNDQLEKVSYHAPQPPYYFAITPAFVTSCMNGRFQNTTIVMMGCEGLENIKLAEAFIEKGVKIYTGWTGSVSSSYTDQATADLLQHLIAEKQTIEQAVDNTMKEVGPDPTYNSQLTYYYYPP